MGHRGDALDELELIGDEPAGAGPGGGEPAAAPNARPMASAT